jgi:hypothetical protein
MQSWRESDQRVKWCDLIFELSKLRFPHTRIPRFPGISVGILRYWSTLVFEMSPYYRPVDPTGCPHSGALRDHFNRCTSGGVPQKSQIFDF